MLLNWLLTDACDIFCCLCSFEFVGRSVGDTDLLVYFGLFMIQKKMRISSFQLRQRPDDSLF